MISGGPMSGTDGRFGGSGMINTEGADLKPAVATRVKKVTIAAIHAG